MVDAALVQERLAILELLERRESPVEQMLLAALWEMWRCQVRENRLGMHAVVDGGTLFAPPTRVFVEPQKVITTKLGRYRADFFVYVIRCDGATEGISPGLLVVEVDGHEWHERSKFQAARDRQRDRAMIAEGFRVVRFTGQEVYRGAARGVGEIARLLI